MKLFPHQERFLKDNPKKAILAWEMRTGKSLPASIWLQNRDGDRYVITPKQNKRDWANITGSTVFVLTKEEFKKVAKSIKNPSAIVIDEAHYFASGLFNRKRSQLATALYTLLKNNPDCDVLLLTATPIRQDATSLHTLLCYIGIYYPWNEWRELFFEKVQLPFLPYPAWMPKSDWRLAIRPYLEEHCDIVSLKDCVAYLPPATTEIIRIKQKPYKRPEGEIVTWTHEHRHEQQGKAAEILKLGYKKLIVVAHFTEQIDALKRDLEKEKPVFVLDGRTKDADAVKRQAQKAEECYFIVQSSMGFGFDGYMFGAIVFASMSHSCTHHTQMLGRQRHLKHLRPVVNCYLIGGRWDQRIFDTIQLGKDFNPHEYLTTRVAETEKA